MAANAVVVFFALPPLLSAAMQFCMQRAQEEPASVVMSGIVVAARRQAITQRGSIARSNCIVVPLDRVGLRHQAYAEFQFV